jgi:hypothetical protein
MDDQAALAVGLLAMLTIGPLLVCLGIDLARHGVPKNPFRAGPSSSTPDRRGRE